MTVEFLFTMTGDALSDDQQDAGEQKFTMTCSFDEWE